MKQLGRIFILWCLIGGAVSLFAAPRKTINVAVASNFFPLFKKIKKDFERRFPYELLVSHASTGKLFLQMTKGAPFELFLAADKDRPQKLETLGLGLKGKRATYAFGKLALWTPGKTCQSFQGPSLKKLPLIALARPKMSPYGQAAKDVLKHWGIWNSFYGKIALGQNVTQTYQYIKTSNAAGGFLSYAQLLDHPKEEVCLLSPKLYTPLEQQMVLSTKSRAGAKALYFYLKKSSVVRAMIQKGGYSL